MQWFSCTVSIYSVYLVHAYRDNSAWHWWCYSLHPIIAQCIINSFFDLKPEHGSSHHRMELKRIFRHFRHHSMLCVMHTSDAIMVSVVLTSIKLHMNFCLQIYLLKLSKHRCRPCEPGKSYTLYGLFTTCKLKVVLCYGMREGVNVFVSPLWKVTVISHVIILMQWKGIINRFMQNMLNLSSGHGSSEHSL